MDFRSGLAGHDFERPSANISDGWVRVRREPLYRRSLKCCLDVGFVLMALPIVLPVILVLALVLVFVVAFPVARGVVVAVVALIPAVWPPAIAVALRDGASADPDVALSAPSPVPRGPDVAGGNGRHDFILRRRRGQAESVDRLGGKNQRVLKHFVVVGAAFLHASQHQHRRRHLRPRPVRQTPLPPATLLNTSCAACQPHMP